MNTTYTFMFKIKKKRKKLRVFSQELPKKHINMMPVFSYTVVFKNVRLNNLTFKDHLNIMI